MADKKHRLVLDDIRGGRNGYDAPWAIKDTQCADAVNVDWYKSRFGRKRGGMISTTVTSMTRTGVTSSLFRHVPGTSETAAELWAVDDAATPIIERLAGGTTWSAPTLKDAPTGNGWDFTAATINGKLFLAYKSASNRLKVWDNSTVRFAGLVAPAAPTAANNGAGTYAADLRYYRVRWTTQSGGITIRRSEPGASLSFTPSGSGTAARVTKPTSAGEGETHWELEASVDGFTFYRIATIILATTTYDDSAGVATYATSAANELSAETGRYTLQKSYKFIAADQNRLLGFGSWTPTDKQSRVEFSAVIGSLDIADEERVDTAETNSYADLDENDSGVATGLAGPIFGAYFAFKNRQIWQLTPTGTTAQPYRVEAVSKSIGALSHHGICRGEDQNGNPALYFVSHRGPYRWSLHGLEYIGQNVEDFVLGDSATINLEATKSVARAVYFSDKRQVWMWWATGSSNDCNQGFIFDVQTSGWSRIPTGDKLANVRCAVMFSNTIGASMSRDLKPHVGQTGANGLIWKADTNTDDNGTAFRAYITTKAVEPGGPGFQGGVGDSIILASAECGVTIFDDVIADFGLQTVQGRAVLSPVATETRVIRRIEGTAISGDLYFIQHQIGDAVAISNAWAIDRVITTNAKHEAGAA